MPEDADHRGGQGIGRTARHGKLAAFLVATLGLSWLALTLPPEGFFSGDSGLKLIAARNAIAHPARPFEIDLPRIGGQPAHHVDPMIVVHRDHAHALQSALFPVISAPFIAVLGLRGAYVLPVLGFLAMLPLLDLIRKQAAPDASFAILAWLVVLANPMLFYSLELWEHAPAVALLAGATAATFLADQRDLAPVWTLASGALGGMSMLLRPEALWYVAGLAVIIGRKKWLVFGCGATAMLIPFGAANYGHSGNVLGPHAAANLAPLLDSWLDGRWQRAQAWLGPQGPVAAAGLFLVAAAWISRPFGFDLRTRQAIGLTGAVLVSALAAQRLLPRGSLWQAFPIVLLATIPTRRSATPRRLYTVAGVAALGIILSATHEGGAQWGPRFLLIATPALLVVSAAAATDAVGAGRVRVLRIALVGAVLVAGLATSRLAYRELRDAKRSYARIVATTAALTSPGESVVTNVWWLDQITASLYGTRVFLYARDVPTAERILRELADAGTSRIALIWAEGPAGETLEAAVRGTCFEIVGIEEETVRSLRIATATCRAKAADRRQVVSSFLTVALRLRRTRGGTRSRIDSRLPKHSSRSPPCSSREARGLGMTVCSRCSVSTTMSRSRRPDPAMVLPTKSEPLGIDSSATP
jgi:hypothetical protein